jgi:uncharacterized membrane protein
MNITAATTIRKEPAEVYAYWSKSGNYPPFMAGADIVRDEPGEGLAWRSAKGAEVDNEGSVTFGPAPGIRGTEVHVSMSYSMPAGKVSELVARFTGDDPHQELDDDLRRVKQILETGEVVRSDGAPEGKRSRKEFPQHAAQPLSADELVEVMS